MRWLVAVAMVLVAGTARAAGERWIRLGDARTWATPCRIGDETRPAAACAGKADAALRIALPPLADGDAVELAAALRPAAGTTGPTRLRALLTTEDGEPGATLWETTLDPARAEDAGWHGAVAHLPPSAREARTLVLEASGDDGHGAPVAWARPVLRRPRDAAPPVPGVVVVLLDGLRADRVGDAAPKGAPPVLSRIARAATRFTRAWAASPDLDASRVSALSGRQPCAVAAAASGPTLGGGLAAAGWATAAIGDDTGLARLPGFDRALTATSDGLTGAARLADRWLDEIGSVPFLLVLETTQITHPESLPPAARARIREDATATRSERERARYDAAVAWTDEQLGGLLGMLTRRGLAGRAVLVVTSLVGFELGEHGGFGAGRTIHAESLHVPLLIHHPGGAAGREAPFPVELRDLARTVVDLAGVPATEAAVPGESLVPATRGERPASTYVFSERLGNRRATAARTARFSWLLRGERLALYDLATDPNEQTDVVTARPAVAADGLGRIRAFRAGCEVRP